MPSTAIPPLLDPTKRVHYTLGLVLGEDEFRQDQGYVIERDRLHNRALHGYGTVSGLAVRVVPAGDGDAEVQVAPGLAVDPHGESICVDATQCARLAAWLSRSATRDRLDEMAASPPDEVRVYLTLGYAERLTDDIPVPGAPCRDEDDGAVASRIDDAFELAFSLDRPPHVEEAAVRQFADFLGRITLVADDSAEAGSALTEAEFLDAVRDYAEAIPLTSPPSSPPDSPPSSPPDGDPVLVLTSEADDLLRAGLRVWVTELRPGLLGSACAGAPGDDDRVLLAELVVGVERDGETVRVASVDGEPDVTLIEDDRPYLLSTRLIQERLLARVDVRFEETLGIGDAAGGDLIGTYPSPTVRGLQTRAVAEAAPDDRDVLTWNDEAAQWEPRPAQADGAAGAAGGDLTGTYPDPVVAGLRGRAVVDTAPSAQDVLTWTGAQWEPRTPATGSEGLTLSEVAEQLPTIPLVTVVQNREDGDDRGPGYFLWFHLDASTDLTRDNLPEVEDIPNEAIAVFAETGSASPAASPFLSRLLTGTPSSDRLPRNTFFLPVGRADGVPQVRIKLDLEQITASVEDRSVTLAEWVSARPVKWEGHDGERTVTVFHLNLDTEADRPNDGPPPPSGPQVVAAGRFAVNDNLEFVPSGTVAGGLTVTRTGGAEATVSFDGFSPDATYVLTGTPIVGQGLQSPVGLEVRFEAVDGIGIRFAPAAASRVLRGLMVQVVQITG